MADRVQMPPWRCAVEPDWLDDVAPRRRAEFVPVVGAPGEITLVDGRTFAISDHAGNCLGGTHGVVHDDLRHVSKLRVWIDGGTLHTLASTRADAPVVRVGSAAPRARERRAVDVHPRQATLDRERSARRGGADRDRTRGPPRPALDVDRGRLRSPLRRQGVARWRGRHDPSGRRSLAAGTDRARRRGGLDPDAASPPPDDVDVATSTLGWWFDVPAHGRQRLTFTVEPIVDGVRAGLPFPIGTTPADAVPLRRLEAWHAAAPTLDSNDPRLVNAFEQALADLAALRIVDRAHPDRVVVAAGAPWFMTLFGRDSLLTSWMTLPFDAVAGARRAPRPRRAPGPRRRAGVRGATRQDPSRAAPSRRRRAVRRAAAGTTARVDATPLFVALAAEAWRWGALDRDRPDRAGACHRSRARLGDRSR